MDELKRLFRIVKNNLKQSISCDKDIFIVLHPRAKKEDLTGCGHLLVGVINGVRKAANVEKRVDCPNLVLVQTIHEVPQTSDNIVFWNDRVFGEKLAIRLEQVMRFLDSSTVYNPFVRRDGRLVNSYGPIRQNLDLDPCGHEICHESFEKSLHEVIIRQSKVFSIFQTFVHGVLYSQHCGHCLILILNFLKSATLVSKFVWNLSRGVWSPKAQKEMEQCFDWKKDDETLYKPNCWRLLEEEEFRDDDCFGFVSSSSSENVSDRNNDEGGVEDVVSSSYEIEESNFNWIATTSGFEDDAAGTESSSAQSIIEAEIDVQRGENVIVKPVKTKASSTKRRRVASSRASGPRAKKSRAVQAVKVLSIQEKRTNMFIKRTVDSGFRVPRREEDVIGLLPKDQSTWNRNHHRMAALGYTYYTLQQFEPEFLKYRSGKITKFKPVVVEDHEEESDEEETSTDEPGTSGSGSEIVSADELPPSSTDSSNRVDNNNHDKLDEVIRENSEKSVQFSTEERSGFNEDRARRDEQEEVVMEPCASIASSDCLEAASGLEAEKVKNVELNEVVMEASAVEPSSDRPQSSCLQIDGVSTISFSPELEIAKGNENQSAIDTNIVIPVREVEVITLEDDDVITLDDSDDDIICMN